MAYVGYPAGSSQAPQSGLPGGAIVPYGTNPLTAGLGAPGSEQQDPRYFQELLNKLKGAGKAAAEVASNVAAAPLTGQVARYAPGVAMGLGSFGEGEIGTGVGQLAGGVVAGKLGKGLAERAAAGTATALAARSLPGAAKLAAPLVGAGVGLATGLAGAVGGGMVGRAAEGVAQAAGQTGSNLISAITGQRKEEGKSGITGGGVGLSNLTGEQKQIAELMRLAGGITVEQAQAMLPIANQMKDADMQRQMQLNQQLGQLTGALNRQQYAFQLAGGAQSQAGENLRTMMTSNPYASSTFRY